MKGKAASKSVYYPVVLGIIFDTKTKKILIGKRKDPKDIKGPTWAFPGGRPEYGEELEDAVKREIKEETNLDVESMGVVFAKTYAEKRDLLGIYFLCGIVGGNEKANEDFSETKWVNPKELKKYFTTTLVQKKENIIQSLANKNKELLKLVIHELKGSSGTVGYTNISELCRDVEGVVLSPQSTWKEIDIKCQTLLGSLTEIETSLAK